MSIFGSHLSFVCRLRETQPNCIYNRVPIAIFSREETARSSWFRIFGEEAGEQSAVEPGLDLFKQDSLSKQARLGKHRIAWRERKAHARLPTLSDCGVLFRRVTTYLLFRAILATKFVRIANEETELRRAIVLEHRLLRTTNESHRQEALRRRIPVERGSNGQ